MRTGAVSARELSREAADRLRQAGVPEPDASAEVLLSELLGTGRGELAFYERPLDEGQRALYEAWLSRRTHREPVQRILGYSYFRNIKLELDEHTLIPRPDTESVVEAALQAIDARGGSCRVLDIGTGSGAIAISVAQERPRCDVYASDISERALTLARRNAESAGAQVHFLLADVGFGLEGLAGSMDVLVSNPPYVRSGDIRGLAPEVRDWEPHAALDGGPDGLRFYRRIFTEAPFLLVPGADVVVEVGDDQAEAVLGLGREARFVPVGVGRDLAGSPRIGLLRWDGV